MEETPLETSCSEVHSLLKSKPEGFTLVDCREQEEHDLVAIGGSTLTPMSEIQGRLSELEPYRNGKLVVYCHHGMRSAQVVAWLRGQGFTDAQSMAGGIDRWAEEIEPGMLRY